MLDKYKTEVEKYYTVPGLCSHFPEDVGGSDIQQMFMSWPSQEELSDIYILQSLSEDDFSEILNRFTFQQNSLYQDSTNFIMTLDWLWDTTNYHHQHTPKQLTNLPIPDFDPVKFGTEEISYTERIDGKEVVFTKDKAPDDLEVYVIDAKPGNFWVDSIKNPRPPMLLEWQHGYSRGIATSKKELLIVYWLIMW
ncbi:MAG: hypothetical protein JXR53_12270 [Bacteroidales bacterium]|nr:hypothetical protein [Bacteroidales bacterium]